MTRLGLTVLLTADRAAHFQRHRRTRLLPTRRWLGTQRARIDLAPLIRRQARLVQVRC